MKKSDQITKQLAKTLREKLGGEIQGIILFGSRARGDFYEDSDYDVIVLVNKKTRELRDKIHQIAWEVGWENGVSIPTFVYEKARFEKDKYEPLFMNVRKEGIPL
ncbi:MAG TPA: nucleotidyltransferase domain-containing protein [Candidatus Avalokitesvara rifleensis]|uniref:nucleotidyltransferase domain-containing protein n=1 Tax=Candidatus Avalokitesvara rifleensis TaxID=3367620 RepID=UPI004025871E